MIATLHHSAGRIEVIPVHSHFEFAKDLLRTIVAADERVFRAQLVDQEYDRVVWDSYEQRPEPRVGDLAFAGREAA